MSLEIQYRITGLGWAECLVTDGKTHALVTASYLTDALGDLARAVLETLQGNILSISYFEEKPGRYRWVFERKNNHINIELGEIIAESGSPYPYDYKDRFGDEYCFNILFETDCTALELKTAVVACLQDMLNRYGKDGYLEKWHSDAFPEEIMLQLMKWQPK